MSTLLFELGTEELPAGYVQPALADMAERFRAAAQEGRLAPDRVRVTGTPRRLTLYVEGLPDAQKEEETLVQGPPAKVAFDAGGKATKAALGFARAQGVDVADLEVRDTERGRYCFARKREPGRPAAEVLPGILAEVARAVSFPKSMRWRGSDLRFARPVRTVVALLDDRVLDLEVFGVRAGRATRGHPFLAPGAIALERADYAAYCDALRRAYVLADVEERKAALRAAVEERLRTIAGDAARLEREDLLEEVALLVEWPLVVEGRFDEDFLEVPAPILEAAMVEHQRYFPVHRRDGSLAPRFLAAANRAEDASGLIREGNERVLRARLSDARFFWRADARATLADRVERLAQVQFLPGLGTYRDKVRRLEELVTRIAAEQGAPEGQVAHARRAALLCKSDLLTEMVGEFPSLQGTVGGLYARREGEPEPVARAIEEHYRPRAASDPLPASPEGRLLALADRLDSLAGGFALGLGPTGSQDPYALRRQALGAIRLVEAAGGARLDRLVGHALDVLAPEKDRASVQADLEAFLRDRLYQLALDRGAPHDLVRAAMAAGWHDVADLLERVRVLCDLASRPEWPALVTVVERTFNIGRNAESSRMDESLLCEPEERRLWRVYAENEGEIRDLIAQRRYLDAALRYAAAFAEPVHVFFDRVFVNVEDARLRANRLALMRAINRLFRERIADLSEIVTGVSP